LVRVQGLHKALLSWREASQRDGWLARRVELGAKQLILAVRSLDIRHREGRLWLWQAWASTRKAALEAESRALEAKSTSTTEGAVMVLRLTATRLLCGVVLRDELARAVRDKAITVEGWRGEMGRERRLDALRVERESERREESLLLQQKTEVIKVLKEQKRRLEGAISRDMSRRITTSKLVTNPAHESHEAPGTPPSSPFLMQDYRQRGELLTNAQAQLVDTELQLKQKTEVVKLLKEELQRVKAQVRTSA